MSAINSNYSELNLLKLLFNKEGRQSQLNNKIHNIVQEIFSRIDDSSIISDLSYKSITKQLCHHHNYIIYILNNIVILLFSSMRNEIKNDISNNILNLFYTTHKDNCLLFFYDFLVKTNNLKNFILWHKNKKNHSDSDKEKNRFFLNLFFFTIFITGIKLSYFKPNFQMSPKMLNMDGSVYKDFFTIIRDNLDVSDQFTEDLANMEPNHSIDYFKGFDLFHKKYKSNLNEETIKNIIADYIKTPESFKNKSFRLRLLDLEVVKNNLDLIEHFNTQPEIKKILSEDQDFQNRYNSLKQENDQESQCSNCFSA